MDELNCVYVAKGIANYLKINKNVPEKPEEPEDDFSDIPEEKKASIDEMLSKVIQSPLADFEEFKELGEELEINERLAEYYMIKWLDAMRDPEEEREIREYWQKFYDFLESNGLKGEEGKLAATIADGAHFYFDRLLALDGIREEIEGTDLNTLTVTKEKFEQYLGNSMVDTRIGILSPGTLSKIENIDEFKENAQKWLSEEIYSRISTGQEIKLLDTVTVKQKPDGDIHLTWYEGQSTLRTI